MVTVVGDALKLGESRGPDVGSDDLQIYSPMVKRVMGA